MKVFNTVAMALGVLTQSAWATGICEPLREQIEFQIANTGATGFAVIVVDADAQVAGKVVGTCAKGARKLVYVRGATGGTSKATARPPVTTFAPRNKDQGVITECRDGTVVKGYAPCKP